MRAGAASRAARPAGRSRNGPDDRGRKGRWAVEDVGARAWAWSLDDAECMIRCRWMAFDMPVAVKTLTHASTDEALAVAVVDVAREASTEATGELVT